MLRWLLTFVSTLLVPALAGAQEPESRDPERFAVVIGVADYDDPRIPDVANAIADAKAIRDWLTTVGGLTPDQVALLLDEGAPTLTDALDGEPVENTRANWLEVTNRWLGERARAGDTVFVYFSGQATADGGRAVLLPRDAREPLPGDTGIDLRALGETLAGLKVLPVVWLDTSFAGRGAPTGSGAATLAPDPLIPSADRLLWIAADPSTIAPEDEQVPHGAFTNTLLRALRGADGRAGSTELQLVQSAIVEPVVDRTVRDRWPLAALGTQAAQRPEVVPQSGHGDVVTALAWHPVRPWLASGDATGVVQITDVDSEQIRLRLPSGRRGVYQLAFSADGERLYVSGRDGVLRAWRTADGELLWEHAVGRFDRLVSLAVHEDVVAVGTTRGFVVVVDGVLGTRRARFRIGKALGKYGPTVTEALAFTPDGRHLVSAADSGVLASWFRGDELGKLSYQRRLRRSGPPIRDLALVGDRVAIGLGTGDVELVGLEDGLTSAVLPSTGYAVRGLDLSPDGAQLAVAAGDIQLWDLDPDSDARHLTVTAPTTAVVWAPDGTTLVSGHDDGALVLWDVASGSERGRLPGQAAGVRHLVFDEGLLLVAGESGATAWDLEKGRLLRRLSTGEPNEAIATVRRVEVPGADRPWIVGGGDAGKLYAWDAANGEPMHEWPLEAPIRGVAATSDGVSVATDRFVERVNPETRARYATNAKKSMLGAEACGEGLVLNSEKGLRRHDPATGVRLTREVRGGLVVRCSPDGDTLAVGRASGRVDLYDARELDRTGRLDQPLGNLAATFLGDKRVTDIAWHPTEPLVATSRIGDAARIWNVETEQTVLLLDTFGTTAIAFGPGRLVITGSSDGLIEFWDLDTGRLVASLLSFGEDWLAWTPDGLFDGSQAGRRDLFRWRIADTLHPPSRFHRGFYEPGLLAAIASGRRPRAERDIAKLAPPPKVSFVSPEVGAQVSEGTVTVEIAVEDQGGGLSDPRLYVNGHRVSTSGGRGLVLAPRGPAGERFRFRVGLAEGRNYLRATAFNAEGNWESLGDERVVEWTAPPTEPPKLHVLAVGIDAYRNQRLSLDFARDDADAIGQFFEPGLFGEVVPYVLLDEQASLDEIRAAFDRVAAAAAPRDALVVYLAGHGVLEGEVFHFLPWDVDVGSSEAITTTGFSQAELGERLASIPAMKQLIVLDACHSGAASEALASLVGRRASPGLVRAQTRLARSTGAFLVAASTEAQVAHEIPELGHGVLTYAMLRGMGEEGPPEAHVDRDGNVTVNTLIQYVSDLVPVLTDTYRRQRQEVVLAAEGQDFPLVAP